MNKIIAIFLLFIKYIIYVNGNDVLGCGGFLKSHVQIDFSKVEVKLLTKQGTLKDKTNCAPNGYYFIPLYDKGEYILQLEPLPGWSFTPTKVNLIVDGKTDLCSQSKDINFVFKGFGITGNVESFGNYSDGPEGVKVELKSNDEVRSTTTSAGGLFFFTPVYPGNYEVSLNHPKWKFFKKSISVTVTEGNTELPKNSLIVEGYDVTGSVSSDGEAIKGIMILLFKSDNNKAEIKVDGCNTSPIENFKLNENFICHVATNDKGVFVFPSLSNGEYYVYPYYKGQNIHFTPASLTFVVKHNSVVIPSFEVIGFSVSGKVLNSINGNPLHKAIVYVNGKETTKTDSFGSYTLEKIKAGSYSIHITYDHLEFMEKSLKINPSILELPDFYPTAYKVCGKVISELTQDISITRIGSTQHFIISSEPNSGKFCKFLAPGKYQLQVSKSSTGLQFFPLSQTIEVSSKPIFDITFSQLKAVITGEVACIKEKDCDLLKVFLTPIYNEDISDGKEITAALNNGKYKFEDIRPGTYEIKLSSNNLCWKDNKFTITINSDKHHVPSFKQTGYSVIFIATHDTKVVSYVNEHSKVTSFDITKGRSTYCVDKIAVYNFKFDGCHIYEPKSVEYSPADESNEINVYAKKHKVIIKVKANSNFGDLTFIVNVEDTMHEEGPLSFKDGYYNLELFLLPNENVVLAPKSDILYFNPPKEYIIGKEDCQDLGVLFEAIKGKVFKGKITPPLPSVIITVESNSNIITVESDSNGEYKLPPLDNSKTYKISASKESYVLTGPDKDGNFLAHKLAEIFVQVLDQDDNSALQGALLSLSGGESYRSNLQTNEEGKISFHSLSPSEYFLRPMMKEYNFQPASKIIDVKEGATVNVLLTGKRVAYSAFGQVMSLNGEPEGKMIVMANGNGNCSQYSEEATSEVNGQFRIRGLQPYCSYDIKVKGSFDDKENIERSTPSSLTISDITSDIFDVKIIVYRPVQNADVLVKVYTPNAEHYKSLRVKVTRETPTSFVIHTTKVDVTNLKLSDENTGILVHLPSVPLDGKLYSIQIESTLPQYNKEKVPIHYFTSNSSFQFADLSFVVKSGNIEEQIKQTSLWTLLFIFSILIAVYNIDVVSNLFKNKFSNINLDAINFKTKPLINETTDDTDIYKLVQSINAVKRKPKPRKI